MKVSSELVREARGGDRAALERLIAATQDPLFHFLRREVGSEADAEDALQETWRQALRSLRDLREPAAFASWIHRIALRAGRDMAVARRARREAEAAGSRNESTEGGGTMEAERREVAGRVREAVEALEPELRTTVRLRYEQGLSYEEIAEAMECPSGTVGKRLHTAHERLRGSLAGAGVALALALLEGELEAAPREAAPAGVRERLREMARRGLPVPDAGAARGVTAGRLVAGVAGLLAIGAAFWGVAALRGREGAGARGTGDGAAAAAPGAEADPRGGGTGTAGGEGGVDEGNVRAAETGRAAGVVKDAESGRPIPGFALRLRPVGAGEEGRAAIDAVTGPSGEYAVTAPPGEYRFESVSDEFMPLETSELVKDVRDGRLGPGAWSDAGFRRSLHASIAAGQEASRDLEFRRGTPIRGSVVDGRGFPVEGARVTSWVQSLGRLGELGAIYATDEPDGLRASSVTGPDGRFSLPAAWPEGFLQLRVDCRGFRLLLTEFEIPELRGDLTLTIAPGLDVAGTVLDADGVPVAGAVLFTAAHLALASLPGRTDALGRFSDRSGAAAGLLVAWAPGHGVAAAPLDGAGGAGLDFRLPRADGRLRGRVEDDLGRPLEGARVRVVGLGARTPSGFAWVTFGPGIPLPEGDISGLSPVSPEGLAGWTGADGGFEIGGVPTGAGSAVVLRAEAPGFRGQAVRVMEGEGIEFALEPKAR